MTGIQAYGVYVPLYRLGSETKGWSARGERAIGNYDEDSITMAVNAAMNCLRGRDRSCIDLMLFASTTVPYSEGPSAALVSTAIDLRHDVLTLFVGSSTRSGTGALQMAIDAVKAGSARQALVIAADTRVPMPNSTMDPELGEGAVAFLIGNNDVAATVEASYFVSDEILDLWREEGNPIVRIWEDRFSMDEGYMSLVPEAVNGLIKKTGTKISDFTRAVVYGPDSRRHRDMIGKLKLDPKLVQEPFFGKMGNTGTAFTLQLLTSALESVKAGDKILLVNYGNGADAMVIKATSSISKASTTRSLGKYLASKRIVGDYVKYASWRNLIPVAEPARRPPDEMPSPANLHRSRDRNFRFYGSKCRHCGTVQYPPTRICASCNTKDELDPYRLSDKPAKLFTYSYDLISRTKDPPVVVSLTDFEGGGRTRIILADGDVQRLQRGMPLEMSFRKSYYYPSEGITNYYWKSTPVRVE